MTRSQRLSDQQVSKKILLLGAPGSGKGTQGARLAHHLCVEHLAVGDLLRAEITSGSELGETIRSKVESGELVSDDLVLELISTRAAQMGEQGYILDGFPRSVVQAERGREVAELADAVPDVVIYLDVPEDVVVERLLARAAIEGRADDNEETVRNRMRVFRESTAPLLAHYEKQGKVRVVDAVGSPDEVTMEILHIVGMSDGK
ncbi:MAG: adenylate kinase [Nocardiaceae bacterium]|nr:adenylate kinase [Nocardiaceae bacterium]